MSNLEHKTYVSYSQRLINVFKANSLQDEDQFNIARIEHIINEFSNKEREDRRKKTDEMPFGKYKFKKVAEVARFDKQYLKWLRKQDMLSNYQDLKDEIDRLL